MDIYLSEIGVMYPGYLTDHYNREDELLIGLGSTVSEKDLLFEINAALDQCDYGKDWVNEVKLIDIERAINFANMQPIEIDFDPEDEDEMPYRWIVIRRDKSSE